MTRSAAWGLESLAQETVEISADEILNLVANPVTLLAPPGRGKALLIISILAASKFGTVAFQNPTNARAVLVYNGASLVPATDNLTDLFNCIFRPQSKDDNVAQAGVGSIANPTDYASLSEIENRAILVWNDGTNFTAGDGSVVVTVVYFVAKV